MHYFELAAKEMTFESFCECLDSRWTVTTMQIMIRTLI